MSEAGKTNKTSALIGGPAAHLQRLREHLAAFSSNNTKEHKLLNENEAIKMMDNKKINGPTLANSDGPEQGGFSDDTANSAVNMVAQTPATQTAASTKSMHINEPTPFELSAAPFKPADVVGPILLAVDKVTTSVAPPRGPKPLGPDFMTLSRLAIMSVTEQGDDAVTALTQRAQDVREAVDSLDKSSAFYTVRSAPGVAGGGALVYRDLTMKRDIIYASEFSPPLFSKHKTTPLSAVSDPNLTAALKATANPESSNE